MYRKKACLATESTRNETKERANTYRARKQKEDGIHHLPDPRTKCFAVGLCHSTKCSLSCIDLQVHKSPEEMLQLGLGGKNRLGVLGTELIPQQQNRREIHAKIGAELHIALS